MPGLPVFSKKKRMGINLGVHDSIEGQDIVSAVEMLLQDTKHLNQLKFSCLAKMDGKGAHRIGKMIVTSQTCNEVSKNTFGG